METKSRKKRTSDTELESKIKVNESVTIEVIKSRPRRKNKGNKEEQAQQKK